MVPLLKIVMADAITTPNTPHTNILGARPKPFSKYTPFLILSDSISPKVPSIANLKKLMMRPWFFVVSLNQSHAPGMKANPPIINKAIRIVMMSDFFMVKTNEDCTYMGL